VDRGDGLPDHPRRLPDGQRRRLRRLRDQAEPRGQRARLLDIRRRRRR
jgi:hypothetical protein